MSGWEVDVETETLSDHKYIRIGIDQRTEENRLPRGKIFPRWNVKKIDKDWCTVSVMCGDWLAERVEELIEKGEIDKAERVLKRVLTDTCNNSMRSEKGEKKTKGKIYWWSAEIVEIRGRCNMWRRRLIRAKSRKDPEQVTRLAEELKKQ